jgi:hypothetical protein
MTVICDITGPICARAPNYHAENELSLRGHHDSASYVGYPETTQTIPYLITPCALSISTVFSIGRASIVCPLPVIVVALNSEL